jgi:hypothetical protein
LGFYCCWKELVLLLLLEGVGVATTTGGSWWCYCYWREPVLLLIGVVDAGGNEKNI